MASPVLALGSLVAAAFATFVGRGPEALVLRGGVLEGAVASRVPACFVPTFEELGCVVDAALAAPAPTLVFVVRLPNPFAVEGVAPGPSVVEDIAGDFVLALLTTPFDDEEAFFVVVAGALTTTPAAIVFFPEVTPVVFFLNAVTGALGGMPAVGASVPGEVVSALGM